MFERSGKAFAATEVATLAAAHDVLIEWLDEAARDAATNPHGSFILDKQRLKPFSRDQLNDLLLEILLVAQSHPEPVSVCIGGRTSGYHVARILVDLCRHIKLLEDRELTELLDFALRRSGEWWPIEELCKHVETANRDRRLGPAVWEQVHAVHASLKTGNSIEIQTGRRRLAAVLWHDPNDAIDENRCWSERLRADLRSMPDAERNVWGALLKDIPISDQTEPPKSWIKQAEPAVEAIGADRVRRQLLSWLRPFAQPAPVRLSMVGSHILKGLLWHARIVRNAEIDVAVLALLDTRWQSKEFTFRPLTVLAGHVVLLDDTRCGAAIHRIRDQLGSKAGARLESVIQNAATGR